MKITQSRNKREGFYTGCHNFGAPIRMKWKWKSLKSYVKRNKKNYPDGIPF